MSTLKTPVGPQPSKVYWRRRLIVGLVLLAIIVAIVLIVARLSASGKPAATNTPKPQTSTSKSATPAAVTACKPANVAIEAVTDKESYAAGVNPLLSLTITNTGTTACTFKVGTDVQVYTITSGTETIWTSTDCQKSPTALVTKLEPGTPVASTPFAWDRTRSDPATCSSTKRDKVVAGGASYHLSVTVNKDKSAKTKQFVLQ
jgi:hypothetical protein